MKSLPMFTDTVQPNVCSPCGGKCCKHMPGEYMPDDFAESDMIARISEGLKSGTMSIDWWEGDPEGDLGVREAYYLRPSVKRYENFIFHGAWGGAECSQLTENGCNLSFEDRPSGCKALVPGHNGYGCTTASGFGKRAAVIAWKQHRTLLLQIANSIQSETIESKKDTWQQSA